MAPPTKDHSLTIRAWVTDSISELGIEARWIEAAEREALIGRLTECFAVGDRGYHLWERLPAGGVRDDEGWRIVAKAMVDHRVVLIGDAGDARFCAVELDGSQLENVLLDCPGFVFYVMDPEVSFVGWFNDHAYWNVLDPQAKLPLDQ